MSKNAIIYPSFKSAQTLCSHYSTITDNVTLWNLLTQYVDSSFLLSCNYNNIREIYNKIILKYYPNELCIKAKFIDNVLLKGTKHVSIFELPVGNSRVDLCKINGTSTAYEIKTDLDNYVRLEKQLQDYLMIFEYVYVVCSENRAKNIAALIPSNCGIYAYHITNRGTYYFNLAKTATANSNINPKKQLHLLHKKEFFEYFNLNTLEYDKGKIIGTILQDYDSQYINEQFKKALKNRYQKQWDFLRTNTDIILEIDYQWFFKNPISPTIIYS